MKYFKYIFPVLMVTGLVAGAQNVPISTPEPVLSQIYKPSAYTTTSINAIKIWIPNVPIKEETWVNDPSRQPNEVRLNTQYFDGLGRLVQTVEKAGSNDGRDLVRPNVYDNQGKETFKFLPYIQTINNASDGKFKLDPFNAQKNYLEDGKLNPGMMGEHVYYSETVYESATSDRITAIYPQGKNWARIGGNRPITNTLQMNSTIDAVRIWKIDTNTDMPVSFDQYEDGRLTKKIDIDENGRVKITYIDLAGNTILEKKQKVASPAEGHADWLCTYYVYDDVGNLRYAIPPLAVEKMQADWNVAPLMDELLFCYKYDFRNREIVRQLPGTTVTENVYDNRDRLVFTRNGNLKSNSTWLMYMYDSRNRLIESALLHGDTLLYTREYLQNLMNTASASSQILSYTIAAVKDLVVANDYTNRYEATNSVTINPGFETAIGKEIEVVVDPNLPGTAVYTNTNTAVPGLASLNIEPLTYIYYDEYNFSGTKSFVGEDTLKIRSAGISTSEDMQPSNIIRGLQTGSRKRILGTDKWITTTNYYDQKKRLVQLVSDNALGGTEVLTNCYDFRDKLVGKYEKFQNPQAAQNGIVGVLTTVTYDVTGKVLATKKRFNDIDSLDRIIVKNSYNGVGNLAKKELGLLNTNEAVATQDYQYNVRGWLNGINAKYVADGLEERRYFGEVLRYDSGYTTNSYNGSIAGMEWRGYNEPIRKSYGFTYDYSNRLIGADYVEQNNVGAAWSSANVDYSVMITGYDANGNIGRMTVKGMKNGQKIVVDDLNYRYKSDGNKLLSVKDNGAIAGELGDFKDSQSDLDDYAYDRNGNQVSDANKGITKIIYNFMNMPEKVEFGAKGSITYVYDASGQKLGKIVIDNSRQTSTTTTTNYMEDLVYESDTLKSWGFKDGRMRILTNKNHQMVYAYDFYVKDHLDNVRMVVKETNSRNIYSATMETALAATENVLFSNIDNTRSNLPAGYPNDAMTNPNQFVARLNAQNGQKVGPSLVLRVMGGDTVTIGTQAFYKSTGANTSITDKGQLLTAILAALSGKSSANGSHGLASQDMPGGNLTAANLQSLIDNNPDQNLVDKPKAYLNYVMFDDQYKMDDQVSGIKQVQATPDELQALISGDLYIKKSGFLYIYTSNESAQDVYFDNLVVAHATSPVMEETHYYPFGGTVHGLSSTALSSGVYSPNKRLFNAMELQEDEFNDGSGLDLYDFGARMYDANTGRFGQIDPLSELHYDISPYAFALNNPVLYKDLFGLDTTRGYTPPQDPKPGDVVVVPRPNGGESYYSYDPSGSWVGNGMNGGTLPTVTATPGKNGGKQPEVVYASFVDGNVSFLDGVSFGATMVGAGLTVIQNKMNKGLWQMVKSSRKAIQKSDLKLGKIGRKLGYFGALLSVSKIILKIADGQPISKKEVFDGVVGAVCAIAVVSNPVSVLVIATYGVLDGTGSLDGIKAAVGIDDSEAVRAFDTPEILHNSLYKL